LQSTLKLVFTYASKLWMFTVMVVTDVFHKEFGEEIVEVYANVLPDISDKTRSWDNSVV